MTRLDPNALLLASCAGRPRRPGLRDQIMPRGAPAPQAPPPRRRRGRFASAVLAVAGNRGREPVRRAVRPEPKKARRVPPATSGRGPARQGPAPTPSFPARTTQRRARLRACPRPPTPTRVEPGPVGERRPTPVGSPTSAASSTRSRRRRAAGCVRLASPRRGAVGGQARPSSAGHAAVAAHRRSGAPHPAPAPPAAYDHDLRALFRWRPTASSSTWRGTSD